MKRLRRFYFPLLCAQPVSDISAQRRLCHDSLGICSMIDIMEQMPFHHHALLSGGLTMSIWICFSEQLAKLLVQIG